MSSNPDDTVTTPAPWQVTPTGLTKRELFAALAMMNIQNVAYRKSGNDFLNGLAKRYSTLKDEGFGLVIARAAVAQADDLIAALNEKPSVCRHRNSVSLNDGKLPKCLDCGEYFEI